MELIGESIKLGRYEVRSVLGKGGNGIVYKAVDPILGRDVALKVGKFPETKTEESQKKLLSSGLREARLAAKFIHPNIAITYDAGMENDCFFMALEYIDGKGLHKHTGKNKLLPKMTVYETIYTICYALDYIHNAGYVHLDIKPANIMMTDKGIVKLMDFGISRLLKAKQSAKKSIAGSVYYMSPEQSNPKKKLDHRSDIFSLGVVFYELLSGKRPFTGETHFQVLYSILNKQQTPIEEICDIPENVAAIIEKAMKKKRKKRFQSAIEMAEALLPVIKGEDSHVLSKDEKKKMKYMKRLAFFKHFEETDLKNIIKISSWSFHEGGSWILKKKESDRNIYMIVNGKAIVHMGKEKKNLFAGECLGESSILHSIPRMVKLRAETDCLVMSINSNILNQADYGIQVKFLKEFYMSKTLQLIEANLKLIQNGHSKKG